MENVSLVMGLRICYPRARLPDELYRRGVNEAPKKSV